jgi:branched-chain amino acid transport system substrate-binding protein
VERLSLNGEAAVPAICRSEDKSCVQLSSPDCPVITGDYRDDQAIVLGALFSALGSTSISESPWQRSAMLAVTEIDAAGGVPGSNDTTSRRPLVLVSCNADADLTRASEHLIKDIRVPALIGPTTSQDTLDVSSSLSIDAGVLVMSPTAVASSIADLSDKDLTWLMAPSDVQRAPLMIQQINALEAGVLARRPDQPVRLGVLYRDDALGIGTRASLAALQINGKPLADSQNLGSLVRIDGYDPAQPNQDALVQNYLTFAPDIIVLAGTAEVITQIMLPLEAGWPIGADAPARPSYLLTDSAKLPALLTAAMQRADLGARVRGTGVRPDMRSQAVFDGFSIDYRVAFQESASYSGMGSSYDAAYALGYALAATAGQPVTGASLVSGLRALSGGSRSIEIGPTTVLAAFRELGMGNHITALGTMAPLQWDASGGIAGGLLEVWCMGMQGVEATPVFRGSGLTYDLSSKAFAGQYDDAGCGAVMASPVSTPPLPSASAPVSLCGNGRIDPGEQCDGSSGCGETCQLMPARTGTCQDILVNEQSHDPLDLCDACRCQFCSAQLVACYHDEKSEAKAALCAGAAECAYNAGCIDRACYCGGASDCARPGGPCTREFQAAAETGDASAVSRREMDPDYALGRVSALGQCVVRNCDQFCRR